MPLSENERYPLISQSGKKLLKALHEHPSAPLFNHHVGDRIDSSALKSIYAFQADVLTRTPRWAHDQYPEWVAPFVKYCEREVPFYRQRKQVLVPFADIPTTCRADFGQAPWLFVPDDQSIDDLIVYSTSGTTGHPVTILSLPIVSSMYVPLLRAALRTRGVEMMGGSGRVSIAQICCQKSTYTFAALSSVLGEAGNLKLNLNPSDWRMPDDRIRYFDAWAPEILTGDPISFQQLASLPCAHHPKALISTSMTLLPGLQIDLEKRFNCPILDLYSMNETGPIAVGLPGADSFYQLLQPRLFIEILTPSGDPCPVGVRGEITVTGGFNPLLPLLRYRTGDQATLVYPFDSTTPALASIEGRPVTLFRDTAGQVINNIDVTQLMRRFAIARFTLHQSTDGSLILRLSPHAIPENEIISALQSLFGADQRAVLGRIDTYEGKLIQYTSDIGLVPP